MAARFRSVSGGGEPYYSAGIGTLGSTINPFATVIAANAAGIPFYSGNADARTAVNRRHVLCVFG